MSNENKIGAGSLTRAKYPLFNQMGDGGSTPTSALQLFVKPISKKTAELCYKMWHYLGDKGFLATYSFGAYYDGDCLGAISYGIPILYTKNPKDTAAMLSVIAKREQEEKKKDIKWR